MKIQCNVCEAAEANVLCCADEASLCWACDQKVHAANKLASKHQRVSLSNSSTQMPKCDICEESVGYFFCLEDRALFCRKCDVAIHTANTFVSGHQRFLLTGVEVGLESAEPGVSTLSGQSHSGERISEPESRSLSRQGAPVSLASQNKKVSPVQVGLASDFAQNKMSFGGGYGAGSMQQWQFDEFLGLTELNQSYGYMENGPSKAHSGRLGRDSDCSPILRAGELELDDEEFLGQVPETAWAVPRISSPPTASGLYWPKSYGHQMDVAPAFVPDISHSSGASFKRRRQF